MSPNTAPARDWELGRFIGMGLLSGGGGRMLSAGFISARRGALPSTESEFGGRGMPEVSNRKAPRT